MQLRLQTKPTALDIAIDEALAQLQGIAVDSDEYTKKMEKITELYKLKEKNTPAAVSADTKAIVAGNLLGILMILHYERVHVVTSKALSFVLKPR